MGKASCLAERIALNGIPIRRLVLTSVVAATLATALAEAARAQTASGYMSPTLYFGQLPDGTITALMLDGNQLEFMTDGCPLKEIRGRFSGTNSGSFSGNMRRCTNPELLAACPSAGPEYLVNCSGTFQISRPGHGQTRINLTVYWDEEIWNKATCEKDHDEPRTYRAALFDPGYRLPDGPSAWDNLFDLLAPPAR